MPDKAITHPRHRRSKEAYRDRIIEFDQATSKVAVIMNELHNTEHSERFWRTLLVKYINTAQQQLDPHSRTYKKERQAKKSLKVRSIALLVSIAKKVLTVGAERRIFQQLKAADKVVYGFHNTRLISQDVGPVLENYIPIEIGLRDKFKRKKLEVLADELEDELVSDSLRLIPSIYVENFAHYYSSVNVYNGPAKQFHLSGFNSNYLRLLVAKYVEAGAKLYYYQHGGVCGEQKYHKNHHNQSSIADYFMTFGWMMKPKDTPSYASYRFDFFEKEYHRHKGDIQFKYILGFPKISGKNLNFIQQTTDQLLGEIYPGDNQILARPHPMNRWLNGKSQLTFLEHAQVVIDDAKQPISHYLPNSELLIMFEHPTTNFLECVYVDHPIMAILANPQPSDIVLPYYHFFEEQGVFHTDMSSLVKHLQGLDVAQWWQQVTAQPMYQEFKDTFCRKK